MAETEPDGVDALDPPQIALKTVEEGVKSASLPLGSMVVMGLLAGAFIALGGLVSVTVGAGGDALPYGVVQFMSGLVFTVGLAMVIVGGAELFTGNTMTVPVALLEKKTTASQLATNWGVVYVTNFVGSIAVAALVLISGQYAAGEGTVGEQMLEGALTKAELTFAEATASGILANFLVCMGVWLAYSARSTVDKVAGLLLPIWAFVAAGLEHSVANMFLVPIGLLIKAGGTDSFWSSIGASPESYDGLTWGSFFLNNLIPATLGNIIGGMVLVGFAYWFVHLRAADAD